jgi:hypothetical protein
VVNNGDSAAAAPWVDRIYLSPDGTLNGAVQLGEVFRGTSLTVGAHYDVEATFTVPGSVADGNYQLLVFTDAGDVVPEGANEGNNITAATGVVAIMHLDLAVAISNLPTTLITGQPFTVMWTVTNVGSVAASGSLFDLVQVRNLDTAAFLVGQSVPTAPATVSLAPGESLTRQVTMTLPDGPNSAGNLRVEVQTDSTSTFAELNSSGTGESNNLATALSTGVLANYSDITALNVHFDSATIQSGQIVTLRWDDVNSGNGATAGAWTDTVMVKNLTTGETLISAGIAYDPAVTGNGAIAAGGSSARQYSFRIADGNRGTGVMQVVVTVDAFNNLFEHNPAGTAETNNITTITVASVLAPSVDLEVHNLVVTPSSPNLTSGTLIQMSWEDSNTGSLAASTSWNNLITVLNVTTGEELFRVVLFYDPSKVVNGPLGPGQSRLRQQSLWTHSARSANTTLQVLASRTIARV